MFALVAVNYGVVTIEVAGGLDVEGAGVVVVQIAVVGGAVVVVQGVGPRILHVDRSGAVEVAVKNAEVIGRAGVGGDGVGKRDGGAGAAVKGRGAGGSIGDGVTVEHELVDAVGEVADIGLAGGAIDGTAADQSESDGLVIVGQRGSEVAGHVGGGSGGIDRGDAAGGGQGLLIHGEGTGAEVDRLVEGDAH